jgi:uncharacterized protein YdhG (YjbR/CyaY superfamily)
MATATRTAKQGGRVTDPKVERYYASAPANKRAALLRLRKTIRAAAPKATESLRYGMVGFMYRGDALVHIAYWKTHFALYGSFDAQAKELKAYDQSGKGTFRFAAGEPLPYGLVTKMMKSRVAELDRGA